MVYEIANELVKRYFADRDGVPVNEVSFAQHFVAGGFAGLCYWVGTFPLDVIKVETLSIYYKYIAFPY